MASKRSTSRPLFVANPTTSPLSLQSSRSQMFFPHIKYRRGRPTHVRLPPCHHPITVYRSYPPYPYASAKPSPPPSSSSTPQPQPQPQPQQSQSPQPLQSSSSSSSAPTPHNDVVAETPSLASSSSSASSSTTTAPPHQSAQDLDPDRARQFEDRLLISRTRSQQLYTVLLTRFVQTASDKANEMLSAPSTLESSSAAAVNAASMATVARRLRKRMRAARSAADDTLLGQQPDHSIWTFLARLQTLIEQLELRADTELAYSRDRLQEDVEYSAAVGDEAIDGDMRSFRNSTRDVDEDQRQKQKQSSYLQQKQVDGGLGLQQPLQERGERLKSGLKKTVSGIEGRVSEFVRKDGSIDVDGLRGWARRLLDSIGVIWMRLNGRTPSTTSSSDTSTWTPTASNNNANTQMTLSAMDLVNYGDDDREARLRDEIGQLEKQLNDSSKEREAALRREDQLGKLIRARQLRQMDDDVNALRRTLAVRVLQFELERVLVGVAEEITRADFDTVLDQRVLVIEFGDLDERLSTLDVFLSLGESILIEDDVLGELAADMQDMKTRLGLDAPLYSSATVSMEQVRQFFTSSSKKARAGFDFYSRGLRLFVGDLGFAWSLISRTVASGYTPSAREVRTLRRTGRDLLTLVPFTIVLIAPLTPVGHVLIFSFLQRYWPEFFPSTFSERRQTMMRKRETYLAKLQSEGKSEHDDFDDDNDDDMNNINGTMDRASTMDDDDDLSAWSRTPGSTTFNPRNPFARRPFSKKRRNKNAAQSNGAASVTGEDERLSRTAAATNSAPSSVDLNIDDLTGKTRAGDVAEQARKERQRVALDELHLAD